MATKKTKVHLYFSRVPVKRKDDDALDTWIYDAEFEIVSYARLEPGQVILLERIVKNFRKAVQEQVFT